VNISTQQNTEINTQIDTQISVQAEPAIFISSAQIQARIKVLASEINQYYSSVGYSSKFAELKDNQKSIVVIGVLKGAAIFTADLIRALDLPVQLEFVRLCSYGDSTESSGVISTPDLALPNIRGRHIVIIEDIVDTGKTATFLKKYLIDQFEPASLNLVSFLNKPSRRLVDIKPDFFGFEIEDKFVIGYGLDFAERYRELDYLGVLEE
jgi:hypoxanthine phosphoribosyltransferase